MAPTPVKGLKMPPFMLYRLFLFSFQDQKILNLVGL